MTDPARARRPAVVFLLPVWGERFITQFLDLSLRTLLAPGNVPAVARECDCTFRILTAAADRRSFLGHPMFDLLSRHCAVEFVDIDDLVCPGVHSLTITLAYVRGMRATGTAMTRTHFVFLVADYVMADGSLAHVLRHIQAGVGAVTTGNFQVVKEDAEALVREWVRDPAAPLSVSPRALLRLALQHLHPVVLASMPDAADHTMICNRLFWRVDEGTLVGRFYLRHMLCIRPERDDFEIGSSCDYSFIPEMCRAGRVVAIADSDDYCVIELQPRLHEREFIVPGALTPWHLAGYLSDWATAAHRANVDTAVVFHAGEVSPRVADVVTRSDAYVRRVARHLPAAPQPHRGHPYWYAARRAAAEHAERQRRFGPRAPFTRSLPEDLGVAAGDTGVVRLARARRRYERFVRQGLVQPPWHPAWLDSRREAPLVLDALREPAGLVVAERATAGTDWMARRAASGWRFLTPAALAAGTPARGAVPVCLIYLESVELSSLPDMLRRIRPWLAADARTLVFVRGKRIDPAIAIDGDLAGFRVERLDLVSSLAHTYIGRSWARVVRRASMTVSRARWAGAAIRLSLLAAAALPANVMRLIAGASAGSPSSMILILRDAAAAGPGDARV